MQEGSYRLERSLGVPIKIEPIDSYEISKKVNNKSKKNKSKKNNFRMKVVKQRYNSERRLFAIL